MRCPDCNKFVSFDEGNVDDVEADIDDESGTVTVSGRVVLPCAECGTELKELAVDETVETADDFPRTVLAAVNAECGAKLGSAVTQEWVDANCKVRYELDAEPEFHERVQATVRVAIKKKGKVIGHKEKPIKSSRYMKTYKGVSVTGTVTRTVHVSIPGHPGTEVVDEAPFESLAEDQASAFDEIAG